MRIFATPIQKRVPEKEISKLIFGVFTEGASRTGNPKRNGENEKFIEKTGNCTSKYREKIQFIEKR